MASTHVITDDGEEFHKCCLFASDWYAVLPSEVDGVEVKKWVETQVIGRWMGPNGAWCVSWSTMDRIRAEARQKARSEMERVVAGDSLCHQAQLLERRAQSLLLHPEVMAPQLRLYPESNSSIQLIRSHYEEAWKAVQAVGSFLSCRHIALKLGDVPRVGSAAFHKIKSGFDFCLEAVTYVTTTPTS